mmetsp:Transcript_6262/g.10873  ORF Transcript_6262/g.10873 Transcript_6262/m.10873 type:complete len:244 (+) Transcript_6262:4045-4776(+)
MLLMSLRATLLGLIRRPFFLVPDSLPSNVTTLLSSSPPPLPKLSAMIPKRARRMTPLLLVLSSECSLVLGSPTPPPPMVLPMPKIFVALSFFLKETRRAAPLPLLPLRSSSDESTSKIFSTPSSFAALLMVRRSPVALLPLPLCADEIELLSLHSKPDNCFLPGVFVRLLPPLWADEVEPLSLHSKPDNCFLPGAFAKELRTSPRPSEFKLLDSFVGKPSIIPIFYFGKVLREADTIGRSGQR